MLLTIIQEIKRNIEYLKNHLSNPKKNLHPHLKYRCELLLKHLEEYEEAGFYELETFINSIDVNNVDGLNTWKQVYTQLIAIASTIKATRIQELPAFETPSSDDNYLVNLLSQIHHELGTDIVNPGVAVNQGHWFSVTDGFEHYPCYYIPHSVLFDLSELPLIYHEISHVFLALIENSFKSLRDVVTKTIERKRIEILHEVDEHIKMRKTEILVRIPIAFDEQLEELACDIMGTLLGGTAYTIALHLGLWTEGTNPFTGDSKYVSKDYRMRASQITIDYLGLTSENIEKLITDWNNVKKAYNELMPPLYYWEYDDTYIKDLCEAIVKLIKDHSLKIFDPNAMNICNILSEGTNLMMSDPINYQVWLNKTNEEFRLRFD